MSRFISLTGSFLLLLSFAGCSLDEREEPLTVEQFFSPMEFDRIHVELPSGRLIVQSVEDSELFFTAKLSKPDAMLVTQSEGELSLDLEQGIHQDEIILQVPEDITLVISTFQAEIEVMGQFSAIDIRSTAGPITLTAFTGHALLWAGRGDIILTGGSGEAVLIGEHGTLSANGFEGSISMTTIMGTLEYIGLENDQNAVHLEVDHGPVRVVLPESTNQSVNVSTTSGYVSCTGVGLVQTVDGCKGQLGSGIGELIIRTVSGRVDLRVSGIAGE